ncbi:LysR family transcriptional regulator [Bifidobacterium aquikefiri]|nr:LysR family transcriptional regulator [Bifidobacterium aquikefiri]
MKRFNPQALVTLWNVERLGSFSAVARENGWSQPAISQQIKKLEEDCGMTLVRRTASGVELTQAGLTCARHGQLIDSRLTQVVEDLQHLRSDHSSHIRLVAPPSACSTFIARVLVHMSWSSDVRVTLTQMEPPEAMASLSQGSVDCAITFRYNALPEFMQSHEDFNMEQFGRDPLLLLVRKSSDVAKDYQRNRQAVNLSSVQSQQWIAGCTMCQANLLRLSQAAGFTPNITHSTDDYWATQNLVEVGMGVSIVPRLATLTHVRESLEACPIRDANAFRSVFFVMRRGDDRPSLRQVRAEVRRAARKYLLE